MSLFSKLGATRFALALLTLTTFGAAFSVGGLAAERASAVIALNPQPLPPFVDPDKDDFDFG
jgi:hypothetical protein